MVYREAASETFDGKVAVAWVAKTRAAHPRWWGTDLYSVLTRPMQFSSMTDPKDPATAKFPKLTDAVFSQCLEIAGGVLEGTIPNPVPTADSYYADYIATPHWALDSGFLKQIGRHRFYTVEGVG
jgi:spore germination cell wall hydrolase CwlJ-like protein